MAMAMTEKVRRDQSIDNMVMEDANERSAVLAGAADNTVVADESTTCRHDVVVKAGRKRAYHETEDLNTSLSENNKELSKTKQTIALSDIERSNMESDSKASSSSHQENSSLESARAEMGEVREENERLKRYLGKMIKDYEALRMQFYEVIKQEETKKSTDTGEDHDEDIEEADQLVSLSLGRFSTESKKDGKTKTKNCSQEDEKANKRELSLALECKFEASECDANEANRSPFNSFEEAKEDAGETLPPKKNLNPIMPNGEDEVVQQNPLKKARVCVRARCDTPTMNDGCQWRKYGQKIAKGNPCPRAYYRCTVAASCPVRKQVQRCAEDMSILITTYEGTHNHPLPLSATAMASTTSAAASMLLSGSSSSTSKATGLNPSAVITTTPANLHSLNFYLSDNSNSKQFYLHNSTLSPSPSHPTITLDLTNSNPSSSSSHFNRFSSSSYPSIPKFAPSTLNFSSSTNESNLIPNWGNGYFGFGTTSTTSSSSHPHNRSQIGAFNIGKPPIENNNLFQSFMQNKKTPIIPQQDSSIAAATKAITADPSFQSALVAALTSIIGNGGDNSAQKFKWGEHFPMASGYCATSYLNKTTKNSQSGGSLMLLPTNSLPYPSPKSNASSSPGDNNDHSS